MKANAAKPTARIEDALERALSFACASSAPPQLAAAVRHAVMPGGARVRPRLCIAVSAACGDDAPQLTDAAAAALELLHCASLVHDDMPCFDDAATRRGRASVHAKFGAPLALLTGDALIVLAFETLARAGLEQPGRLGPLTMAVSGAVGMPAGITAGQGWESEADVPMDLYHRAKTGALFIGAVKAGAIAAGSDPNRWTAFGDRLGEAYQVADDLRDAAGDAEDLGKPVGQDAALGRPNAVAKLGLSGALSRMETLVRGAIDAIPDCPGASMLEALMRSEAKRLVPAQLAQSAA